MLDNVVIDGSVPGREVFGLYGRLRGTANAGGACHATVPTAAGPPGAPSPEPPGGAPTGQIVVVRGTGGAGVRLRAQPGNSGQVITVVAEYTPLVIVGPDGIVDGMTWAVCATPGGDGWIAASFVTTGGTP